MSDPQRHVEKLKQKYRIVLGAQILMYGIASSVFAFGILQFVGIPDPAKLALAMGVGAVHFIAAFVKHGLHRFSAGRLVAIIDKGFPEMENSADLLLEKDGLTTLEMLQREKVQERFIEVYPRVTIPHRLWNAAVALVISIAGTAMLFSLAHGTRRSTPIQDASTIGVISADKERLPAGIQHFELFVQPPSYTGIPAFRQSNPTLEVPEGSAVTMSISFTDSVQKPLVVFSGRDTIDLANKSSYQYTAVFRESTLYQVSWQSDGKIKTSDHFRLTVIPDAPPDIQIRNLDQFTQLTHQDNLVFAFNTDMTDDYGLTNAYIIATVSKGSGESVKFREVKLPFHSPAHVRGKNVRASRKLDLPGLGLEPGDELYFYVETFDNRMPVPNKSRTETYFVTLQDTASHILSVEGGLGVDLMPEYFRSQRQIIIDSEKLLRERKSISRQEFNSRSNELGYDQKVLRLKYGEFLGEEFETSIGPGNEIPEDDHADENAGAEDPTAQYAHIHDKENEHNLVQEKRPQPDDHDHDAESDPEKKEDPTAAYRHVHDDPEEATFFTQSIRAKLKAALTVMWDAELHLRMFDPEKSLPYQYQALKLLKEISNDSRIYVHRTGFDPPPLKEEKRLTGDLSEIQSTRDRSAQLVAEKYPSVKIAGRFVDQLIGSGKMEMTAGDRSVLLKAGQEIASIALERPDHLTTLSMIKGVTEEDPLVVNDKEKLVRLRKALWSILESDPVPSQRTAGERHFLDQSFIQKLEGLKNE